MPLPVPLKQNLPVLLPLLAILIARAMVHSTLAAEHPLWAASLFAWIVVDALFLGFLAKTSKNERPFFRVLGVGALAAVVLLAGASTPVREVYLDLPAVMVAAAGTLAIFLGWSSVRIFLGWREGGSLPAGLERVLPVALVRFIVSECRMIRLGLFRWGLPVDIPESARGFTYHLYLRPMIIALAVLQVIELGMVHLLLTFLAPNVALIFLALGIWGLIWTLALLKSLRINPVLLTADHVRVRAGMLQDFEVPLENVVDADRECKSGETDSKKVPNLAFLTSPNVILRFREPITISTLTGRTREIEAVAMRLDESHAFFAELHSLR